MYLDLGSWNVTLPNVARGMVVTGSNEFMQNTLQRMAMPRMRTLLS
jgi:hypothetical protein